jgi:hypothetical protein
VELRGSDALQNHLQCEREADVKGLDRREQLKPLPTTPPLTPKLTVTANESFMSHMPPTAKNARANTTAIWSDPARILWKLPGGVTSLLNG